MANEITAEMLAREMAKINGYDPDTMMGNGLLIYLPEAHAHLLATRALASLQAERAKDAPERVRCWIIDGYGMTRNQDLAQEWIDQGYTVTEGYFTAKGSSE